MRKKITEAVISSSKSKPFIKELSQYFEDNKTISFADLAIMAYPYGIEVVDYKTFYDELPELWKKGEIPHKKVKIFGLANPNTKKPRLVVTIDEIDKNQFFLVAIIVSHEFVHAGQMDRLKPGVIYVPPKTVYDFKKYYSDYQEVMAWSKTIVDEIIHNFKPESFDDAMKMIFKSDSPVIVEVMCQKWQEVVPTLMGKKNEDGTVTAKPLEDMYPFLSREEFYANMIVTPVD